MRNGQPAAALADEEFFRLPGDLDDFRRHQCVVNQRVGFLQGGEHFERQQARIAGTRARQPDMAGFEARLVGGEFRRDVGQAHCRPLKRRW